MSGANPWVNGPLIDQGNVVITGGTFMGGTLVGASMQLLGRTNLPMISAPTGTMGNNGAITLGTALDRIYANCYLFLPAGAIAAGVPASAGWLYAEMSSTTVGTVFNNAYTTGMPSVPASKTAFVTTGPGAYTGDTAAEAALSITVPANLLAKNGILNMAAQFTHNNSAGAKVPSIKLGASTLLSSSQTTTTGVLIPSLSTVNAGVANVQNTSGFLLTSAAAVGLVFDTMTAIDTTSAQTLTFNLNKAVATDYHILQFGWATVGTDGG